MRPDTKPLGDLRAEDDAKMLDVAFLETPDYLAILEAQDRPVVVGRRGTGKSALVYRLRKAWKDRGKLVTTLSPEEDQAPGFRAIIEAFGPNRRTLRAAARKLWQHAFLMEAAIQLSKHYRFTKSEHAHLLTDQIADWMSYGPTFAGRLRRRAAALPLASTPAAQLIGDLDDRLGNDKLRNMIVQVLEKTKDSCVLMVDRIDEGFDPDDTGVEIVIGLVYAAFDLNAHVPGLNITLFLRDNVFRAIARNDDDYSRNIEGSVIRLHWGDHELLAMVARRMRTSFGISGDRPQGVWDRCVALELRGFKGFRACLAYTLYRPRDVLLLLNEAYFFARRQERTVIVPDDVNAAAKEISKSRLDDLRKEYAIIVAGVAQLTSAFSTLPARMDVAKAREILHPIVASDNYEPAVQQAFAFYETTDQAILSLYGIGFLGLREPSTGVYAFCHDGREPPLDLKSTSELLIHPCYWKALDILAAGDESDTATEVFDDYDMQVRSTEVDKRKNKIGKHIGELQRIPAGDEGSGAFEEWCAESIRCVFAGGIRNVELKPNACNVSRRDVVGRNEGGTAFWKRVLEDYQTRQVVFEIKNYDRPLLDDYRQLLSYLGDRYGSIGFLVYRSDRHNLSRDIDLAWMKEYYSSQRKLIVRLSSKALADMLSKLRSPEKAEAPDEFMSKLLDQYQRNYLGEQVRRRRR